MTILEALKELEGKYGNCAVTYGSDNDYIDSWIEWLEDPIEEAARTREADVTECDTYVLVYVEAWNEGEETGRIVVYKPRQFVGDHFIDDMLHGLLGHDEDLSDAQYHGVLRFVKNFCYSHYSTDEAQARITAFEDAVDATNGRFYLK